MRVHSLERSNALQARQLGYVRTYRGWVRPAWMWSCIVGCVAATTISALVLVVVGVALAQYRSGIYEVATVELVAMTAVEGGLIGYFQWRVLLVFVPNNDEWALGWRYDDRGRIWMFTQLAAHIVCVDSCSRE